MDLQLLHEKLFKEANDLTNKLHIPVCRANAPMGVKCKRHTPARLNQDVVGAPIGENEDNDEISFHRTIHEIIDKVGTR